MKNYETIIEQTCQLIKIPSTKKAAKQRMPFGEDIDKALEFYLSLASGLGFETYKDPNGYYGLVEYGSQTDPLAILGHIDVVNGGDISNWTKTKPFSPKVIDNVLYGRGAEDMKLPMITILHVLQELRNSGHQFKRGVRIIVGTDEENEFRCMENYAKNHKFPTIGFTPDGSFPVVNVETSLVELEFTGSTKYDFIVKGGADFNTVADIAYYQGKEADQFAMYLKLHQVSYLQEGERVTVFGKSVHVSDIEKGKSAINLLCYHLYNFGIHANVIDLVAEKFILETNAQSFLGKVNDQFTGDLVCNCGLINIDSTGEYLGIDLRIPVMYDQEIIIIRFESLSNRYLLKNNLYFNDCKVYVDEDADIVQKALSVYKEITGENGKAINSRGGSYSKVSKRYVGIGMNFPQLGQNSTAHRSDECFDLRYLERAYKIYKNLIVRLTR